MKICVYLSWDGGNGELNECGVFFWGDENILGLESRLCMY